MKSIFTCGLVFFSVLIFGQAQIKDGWPGKWAGKLEVIRPDGKVQSIPMELHIALMDSSENFTFTIIYGEDQESGKRSYELHTLDAEKGLYVLDEKNTIRIEAFFIGEKLYQWYEVAGSMITVTIWLEGEEMNWELVSGSAEPVSHTGGTEVDGERVPPVKTFPVRVVQRARLKKQ